MSPNEIKVGMFFEFGGTAAKVIAPYSDIDPSCGRQNKFYCVVMDDRTRALLFCFDAIFDNSKKYKFRFSEEREGKEKLTISGILLGLGKTTTQSDTWAEDLGDGKGFRTGNHKSQ